MQNEKISPKRRAYTVMMKSLMLLSVAVSCGIILFLIVYVTAKGLPNITWELLSTSPSVLDDRIGILPDIMNTVYIVLTTILIIIPLGVGAAVYLTEYAKNKKLVAITIIPTRSIWSFWFRTLKSLKTARV